MTPKRISIDLQNPYCAWNSSKAGEVQVWTRGQAWDGETYLEGRDLADWLCRQLSNGSGRAKALFEGALPRLNGSFALVAQTSEGVFAAMDRLRSIPLFYGIRGKAFLLSDDVDQVLRFVGDTCLDDLSVNEFLLTGYVTGADTLFPNVKQIQAGEFISVEELEPPSVTKVRYYRFLHSDYFDESEEQLYALMTEMYARVFDHFVKSVQGRRIVVPLSGGLDSRSIVAMLKRMGVQDVLCFSYGRPGNWESEISQKVARRLGYEWCFVPYTRRRWRSWFQSRKRHIYLRYGSGAASIAVLQDWAAVWEMKKAGILQEGDVIVPGHSADFLGGSHIPASICRDESMNCAGVIDSVLRKHYSLWKWQQDRYGLGRLISARVASRMAADVVQTGAEAVSVFEEWDWQERQAKFIVNNIRVYEFWGYDWRIPLWDNEMMDFWARVPLDWRIGKQLYDSYLEMRVFSQYGIEGLYPSWRAAGWGGRLRSRWKRIQDPQLGRYSVLDNVRSWYEHQKRFDGGFRSIPSLLNPNTLNVSILLDMWEAVVWE